MELPFELISTPPQLFRERHGPYRLAPTQRFPHSIYFIRDEVRLVDPFRRILQFKQDSGLRTT